MTAAPDSPPFALPLRIEKHNGFFFVYENGRHLPMSGADQARAEYLIRAVNSYAKMREALEKIGKQKKTDELETACDVEYADFEQGYDDSIAIARAILKEIDNG